MMCKPLLKSTFLFTLSGFIPLFLLLYHKIIRRGKWDI
ncbi:hypothetical protein Cabys_3290 [Caldithrix abyssi DSM 13497]|uniref:Uncharacterized protein n=1 Tax=Caldithrix abyssi DSM 13497 TaxID=880073 RepID=A0A1J1CBX4_CALAY|nr:hypothetical protein Cabys_3290 [Caldithrix abyssi DSM 13497]